MAPAESDLWWTRDIYELRVENLNLHVIMIRRSHRKTADRGIHLLPPAIEAERQRSRPTVVLADAVMEVMLAFRSRSTIIVVCNFKTMIWVHPP